MVEAAAKSWATPAILQADSRVLETSVKTAVDIHQWFGPDDTWLRRIGTCQMLLIDKLTMYSALTFAVSV